MGKASRRKRDREGPLGETSAPVSPPAGEGAPPAVARPAERIGWFPWPLIVVLAAAALFRVAYFFQFQASSVFFDTPLLDAWIYDDWARKIAEGAWLPEEPFYFAPGYPYALALLYRFVSSWVGAIYIAQFLLGLLGIVLIHRLAALTFGRREANVAAGLAALYASFPFLEAKIMSATLPLTLFLLALVVLAAAARSRALWGWLLAGLLMGLTSLVRPETLLAGPFLLLWLCLRGRPPVGGLRRWGAWRPTIAAALALCAAWALAVAPAAAINISRGGGRTLISSQGGITFYQSNNPRARGLYVFLSREGFSGSPGRQAQEEKEIAEKAVGRPLTRSEVSSHWFGKGLEFIREQPGRFVWLLGMKLLRFVGSYEYSTEYILYVERETVWLLWLPFVPFGLLVALGLPAIGRRVWPSSGRGRRSPPGLNSTGWLLLTALAANLAACLAFYISSRYRLPSVPSLIVFAAATLVAMVDAFQRGRRADLSVTAALVLVLFVAVHFEKDESARIQEANVHYNSGNLWAGKKEHERAIAEYGRALEMDDSRYTTWFNMGNSLRDLGRYDEAAGAYGEAAGKRKNFLAAHLRQGSALVKTGDLPGAREAYERAAKIRPGNFQAQLALGRIAARLGEREAAIRHLDRALEIRPDSEAARRERARL